MKLSVKNIIKNVMNTDSVYHISSMIISITFLTILILLIISFNRLAHIELNIETYKNLNLIDIHENSIKLINLEKEISTIKVDLAKLQQESESNTIEIGNNRARIKQNQIDIDEISYEGIMTHIEEIWDELQHIRKVGP